MSKNGLTNVAILLVATLVALGLGEVVLRFPHPKNMGIQTYSNLRAAPNFVALSDYLPVTAPARASLRLKTYEYDVVIQSNDFGYRGPNPKRLDKGTARRVLLLGDSYMLGMGATYEQGIAGVLQSRLGSTVEVINAAYRAGVSPDAYYAYLVREGLALRPDAVVLMIGGFSDLVDLSTNEWLETDDTGAPIKLATTLQYTGLDGYVLKGLPWYLSPPVLRNSYLFVGAATLATQLFEDAQRTLILHHILPAPQTKTIPPAIQQMPAIQRMAVSLKAISDILSQRKIPIITLVIPPPFISRLLQYRIQHDAVVDAAKSVWNTNVIDLKKILHIDDYLFSDGHLSVKGNALVANVILQRLPDTMVDQPMLSLACRKN